MTGIDVSWLWLAAAIALIAGIAIGALIAYRFLPSATGNRRLTSEIEDLKATHARYRRDVEDHFAKTGELFENLTNSYRDVYEHLASGAVSLGRESTEHPKLDLPDARRLTEAAQGARSRQTTPDSGLPAGGPAAPEPTADESGVQGGPEQRTVTDADSKAEQATATDAEGVFPEVQKDSGLGGEEEPEERPRALH